MEQSQKKKYKWLITLLIGIVIGGCIYLKDHSDDRSGPPILTVETPQKLSASSRETFTLDVRISDLGEVLYPAASMSIRFDSSCLEFLGLEEGNLFVLGEENAAGQARKLPDWSCNPEKCNESGWINIMYLDLTGGKYAFSKTLLPADAKEHVAVRLNFRLRGSVRAGDVYDLIIEDAVFAASDPENSLALNRDTLKIKNGKIVIGE